MSEEPKMTKRKSGNIGPKLTREQQDLILRWVAAGMTNRAVLAMGRMHNFPSLTSAAISYYRTKYSDTTISEERQKFIETALNQGWADRKNRVEMLSGMIEDWVGRAPTSKEVTEMVLKIEKQLSERVDEPSLQRVKLEFDSPTTMEDLMEGLSEEV